MNTDTLSSDRLLQGLRLVLVPGVGPRTQQNLLNRFGSAEAVFSASLGELLSVPGIGQKLARTILDHRDLTPAREELALCERESIGIHLRGEPDYPGMLEEITDPPLLLFSRGSITPADQLAIGIVGSRHCTPYGTRQAELLAASLARAGLTIISGLARGIDAAAHQGALDAGGRTLAIAATGMGTVYPPEHKELASEISQKGAVLTESPYAQKPLPGLFPQRNRIISGLSLGVIVVEAHRKSGALHTARHAMEQNREVFVVPGRIDSPASEACHDLIRDGATLIRGADDVLEALGPLSQPVQRTETEVVHTPRELNLDDQERTILNLVTTEPQHVDEILRACPLEASRVLATLTILEMKRLIRRLPGGMLVRSPH